MAAEKKPGSSGDEGVDPQIPEKCRNRFKPCQHYCGAIIFTDEAHSCPATCPLMTMFDPGCGHHVLRKCGDIGKEYPARACMMTCGKTLACSHLCLQHCYLPCQCSRCQYSPVTLLSNAYGKPATGVKSANNGISEGTNSSSTRLLEPNPNHNPFGGTNHFKKVKAPARTFQFRNYSHTNPDEKEPEQTAERSEDASLEMEKIDSTHDDGTTATEDLHEPVRPRPPKDTVVTSQEKGTLEKSPKPESLPLIVNSLGEVNPFFATRAVGISSVEDEYSLEAQFTFGRRRPRRRRGVEAPRSISNVNPTEHRSLPLADIQTPLIELENNPNPPDPPVMSLPFMAIHSSTFDTERAWRLGLAKCTCGHYFPSTNENCDCGQMNPFFRFTT